MKTIGLLEDKTVHCYRWKRTLMQFKEVQLKWFKDFETLYENLNKIDVLVADWEIKSGGNELLFGNEFERIKTEFGKPIFLWTAYPSAVSEEIEKKFSGTIEKKLTVSEVKRVVDAIRS